MMLRIFSTEEVWVIEGVECRRWQGVDEEGLPCDVFVHRIGSADVDFQAKAHRLLIEKEPPREIEPT